MGKSKETIVQLMNCVAYRLIFLQIATHDQSQVVQDQDHGTVQLLVDTCNTNNVQERLFMCTDCNLAFYGEQGEQEWQWHLKQHKPFKCDLCSEAYEDKGV